MGANIIDTHKIVKTMLRKYPETRSSDGCLCYMVYKEIGKKNGVDIDKISLQQFFLHMRELGFPATETIRRARQKIQAQHKELAGTEWVECHRTILEDVYKDYATSIIK